MEYRPLGATGLDVSVLGVGVEHLKNLPVERIASVIRKAVGRGVNYFDLVWNFPNVIAGVANGIADSKEDVHLAVHLGSCHREGKYVKSRTPRRCEAVFRESLERLDIEGVVINIHYVRTLKEWRDVTKAKGILDLALKLRDEGLGKSIALSTHDVRVVELAAKHPEIGSIMYQVNMGNHQHEGRDEVLRLCADTGTGVVAMKPYAKGKLLRAGRTINLSTFDTGGLKRKLKIPQSNTVIRCLSYALSQEYRGTPRRPRIH
jgi:predicted aldo/keto reductase-like oxidoreductase